MAAKGTKRKRSQGAPLVSEAPATGGFATLLQKWMERRGMTAPCLGQRAHIHRARIQQLMANVGQPPQYDGVEKIAQALRLDRRERNLLHWVAIRERAEPQARALLRVYEAILGERLGIGESLEAFVELLGERLECALFVTTARAIGCRHLTHPVRLQVYDPEGRVARSIPHGWIVQAEPFGMHPDDFFEKALDHLVFVNVGRVCRIGWLRRSHEGLALLDDHNEPIVHEQRGGSIPAGAWENGSLRENAQAFINDEVSRAIQLRLVHKGREELEQELERVRRAVFG